MLHLCDASFFTSISIGSCSNKMHICFRSYFDKQELLYSWSGIVLNSVRCCFCCNESYICVLHTWLIFLHRLLFFRSTMKINMLFMANEMHVRMVQPCIVFFLFRQRWEWWRSSSDSFFPQYPQIDIRFKCLHNSSWDCSVFLLEILHLVGTLFRSFFFCMCPHVFLFM